MEGYYQPQQQQVLPIPLRNPFLQDSSEISDSESSVTGSSTTTSSSASSYRRRRGAFLREGDIVELSEGERIYELIRRRFLSCVGPIKEKMTSVVSIHRKDWSACSSRAKLQAFQIHSRAVANKNGGITNVKFGWYGSQREKINQIMANGFSFDELQQNNFGAILLSPDDSADQSVEDSIPDEDGLRYMLLCRVILGKSELVQSESAQTHPSSDEFDSGVFDEFANRKKYIVWSTNMNTHILPEYIVSFRASYSLRDESKMENRTKRPTSPWISFPALISVLGRFLPSDAICLMNKHHNDYKERRIPREDLIQRVREIAGDKLLIAVIKSYRGSKELKASMGFLRNRNGNK